MNHIRINHPSTLRHKPIRLWKRDIGLLWRPKEEAASRGTEAEACLAGVGSSSTAPATDFVRSADMAQWLGQAQANSVSSGAISIHPHQSPTIWSRRYRGFIHGVDLRGAVRPLRDRSATALRQPGRLRAILYGTAVTRGSGQCRSNSSSTKRQQGNHSEDEVG